MKILGKLRYVGFFRTVRYSFQTNLTYKILLFLLLSVLTACTTFASACSYAFMRDTYRFSHRDYDHQAGKKLAAFAFFVAFNACFAYSSLKKAEEHDASEKS